MMATELDLAFCAMALDMLNLYGKTCTYTHLSGGTFDPNTSRKAPAEIVANPKVFIDMDTGRHPTRSDLSNGVLINELSCYLAAQAVAFVPTPQDHILLDGVSYRVRPVRPFYSGELVALWLLGVTRS